MDDPQRFCSYLYLALTLFLCVAGTPLDHAVMACFGVMLLAIRKNPTVIDGSFVWFALFFVGLIGFMVLGMINNALDHPGSSVFSVYIEPWLGQFAWYRHVRRALDAWRDFDRWSFKKPGLVRLW